jgi:pimeloyl-ACP methyl ester carboxylesterase
MRLELVSIVTDTEPIDGLYCEPEGPARGAALLMHGNCSNFYTGPSRFLPEVLAKAGYASFAYNRRGHDVLVNLPGRRFGGGALQMAGQAIDDNRLAAGFLAERGFVDPIVIGHSNGGMLAVKHVADHPGTPAVVLLSAHRGGKKIVPMISEVGLLAGKERERFAEMARKLVAEGRGGELTMLPGWWWVTTPESYLDYSFENPDMMEEARKISCPSLFIRGDSENTKIYPAEEFAAATGGTCDVRILDHCDHFYTGIEAQVAEVVVSWIEQTLKRA